MLVLCKFSLSFLLVLLFRSFLQVLCRCSALFLMSGALGEYQSLIQETVPRDIEHRSNWGLEGSQILQQLWKMGHRALLAAARAQGCFRSVKKTHHLLRNDDMLAALGRFVVQFWTPLGFEGVPKSTFVWTKWNNCKKERSKKRLGKNKICRLLFDAKMGHLKWFLKNRIILVVN